MTVMGYTMSRDFSAPAEVVFGVAMDLNRWGRWLPPGVQVDRTGADELRVVWSGGTQTVRWQVTPADLTIVARPVTWSWSGSLRVVERPAGGSTARLEIDGDGGPSPAAVERALAHLGDEVSENFTDG
jgi:hypothetical protein